MGVLWCSGPFHPAEHLLGAQMGALLVFSALPPRRTPLTCPNGRVVGVRRPSTPPNTSDVPMWAHYWCPPPTPSTLQPDTKMHPTWDAFSCLAGFIPPEHHERAQMATFMVFGRFSTPPSRAHFVSAYPPPLPKLPTVRGP